MDGKPVAHFPALDDAFYQVVEAIKHAIAALPSAGHATNASATAATTPPSLAARVPTGTDTAQALRSSNLLIRRLFTDRDRDQARREGYQSVAGHFEKSLEALKEPTPTSKRTSSARRHRHLGPRSTSQANASATAAYG